MQKDIALRHGNRLADSKPLKASEGSGDANVASSGRK
jgi:hypothetical protein